MFSISSSERGANTRVLLPFSLIVGAALAAVKLLAAYIPVLLPFSLREKGTGDEGFV
jgi:hypothetical protein